MLIFRKFAQQGGLIPRNQSEKTIGRKDLSLPITPCQKNEEDGKNWSHEKAHEQQEGIRGWNPWGWASPGFTHCSYAKRWGVSRKLSCPPQILLHGICQCTTQILLKKVSDRNKKCSTQPVPLSSDQQLQASKAGLNSTMQWKSLVRKEMELHTDVFRSGQGVCAIQQCTHKSTSNPEKEVDIPRTVCPRRGRIMDWKGE